jgi:hypothetical protein
LTDRRHLPKSERFAAFLERLRAAPAAATFNEAYQQLCAILNEIEDTVTSIPHNPDNWRTDGRMYPPQLDSMHEVPDRPAVRRFRSRGHNTFLGANGSIEIQLASPANEVVFAKPGADGREVSQL